MEDGRLERAPHPLENPSIPFTEIEHLYRTMPDRAFRQEILAEFLEDGGGVFRRVREAATAPRQERAADGHAYVIGCDWGRSHDYTVYAVVDASTKSLVSIERSTNLEYALQRGRLVALCERFAPGVVLAESNAMGQPIIEALSRDRVPVRPFVTTNASKAAIIDGLALAFERGDIQILDEPWLIAELEAYEQERLPSGLLRSSAPAGMHDDGVMALAMAWSVLGRANSAVGAFG
jgi:hypothetical protein